MSKGIPNDKKQRRNKIDYIEVFNQFKKDGDFSNLGKLLGKGSFGEVREVTFKNKIMAAKIVMQEANDKSGEYYASDLKGRNIIKIHKISQKVINHQNYYLIIMDKAILKDLGKLSEFYHHHNLLKFIMHFPFDEEAGDNLMRFYAIQIVNALETLNRNYMVHFDLKPENLLISLSLIIKLSDFSLLKRIKDDETLKIPGGTSGYLTMEYYKKEEKVFGRDARKQDYFALGSTLFYLKYGTQMLKYKRFDNYNSYILTILEKLQYQKSKIQSSVFTDQDFIDFLLTLVGYSPDERPTFEEIYRNKWLNKNLKELNETFSIFESDEEKLIIELQKNDFLIEKQKQIKKTIQNKKPSKYHFKTNKKPREYRINIIHKA